MQESSLPNILFMEAHLGRFEGADDALKQEYPTNLVYEDGEEFDRLTLPQERGLELLQEE